MTHSHQFLRQIVVNPDLQQTITSLRFDHIQAVAARYGYTLAADDVDAALRCDPALAVQISDLITGSELEFELDEAEMALIAGGGPPSGPVTVGDQSRNSSVFNPGAKVNIY